MLRRREFIASGLPALAQTAGAQPAARTEFQIACMTLPYSPFPFERALAGIKQSGYRYVAWGHTHRDSGGVARHTVAIDAPPADAARQATRTRDLGLEPVMMFSNVALEAAQSLEQHLRRIEHAAAARIPFLLTFGKTEGGQYESVIRNLKGMAAAAKSAGVMVVIKQHGGNTGTGEACARIVKEVAEPAVRICYDAGNVLDYERKDPLPDIRTCWQDIRAFAIKDHRVLPKNQDCGPGFGEIDHFKLLMPVMRTGLAMPLACENIFEPLTPRPASAEGVDALARRAREYLESVLRGLETLA